MTLRTSFRTFVLVLLLSVCAAAQGTAPEPRIRFKVQLDQTASKTPVSGRLLVYMTTEKPKRDYIEPSYGAETRSVWIAAREVRNLKPGESVEVDPDQTAFPAPFSKAPNGNYYVMALLDTDHNAAYQALTAGDVGTKLQQMQLNPAAAGTISLTINETVPNRPLPKPENTQVIEFTSAAVSKFMGRPSKITAVVALPPKYASATKRYPAVYVTHGYGATLRSLVNGYAAETARKMAEGKIPEMIFVFLSYQVPGGTHEFADSVNNGPWGQALTTEFIPYLEKKFRIDARPQARFLTGHSSGGWSTIWLQVAYPKVFGGAWATSPDPVDFRNFTGPDIASVPPNNFYRKPDGSPWYLVRMDGKDVETLEDYARQEQVVGEYGGQMASFEWVFSPRGEDGRPKPLFNRATGVVDPEVAKYWQRYDISRIIRTSWKQLGPNLKGKLHIYVGTQDTFHLESSVRLLDQELKKLNAGATVEYLEGKDHFNLYEGGLSERIYREMAEIAARK